VSGFSGLVISTCALARAAAMVAIVSLERRNDPVPVSRERTAPSSLLSLSSGLDLVRKSRPID
jgi:hypothetical protein